MINRTRQNGSDNAQGQRPMRGEATLVGSWEALAAMSPGAHLIHAATGPAAVFPSWEVLNNAILRDGPPSRTASRAAMALADLYADAGVASWALWLPNQRPDFQGPDTVSFVDGMVRDTTTLVMTLDLSDGMPVHPGVVGTTAEVANLAGDTPIPADALPHPDDVSGIQGWVLVRDRFAVAGAWTYLHGSDVGVYAVGTAPQWRRRGLALSLMLHALGHAYRRGARSASLQSTPMGEPLYRSLGFRPVGRYEEWIPAGANHSQHQVNSRSTMLDGSGKDSNALAT